MTSICKLLREFALEYRTCRERVLQQHKKRAAHRERSKTRGRLITEVMHHHGDTCLGATRRPCSSRPQRQPLLPLQTEKFSGIAEAVLPPAVVSSSPKEQMEAGHESMKIVLTSPTDIPARRSRASQGRSGMAEELKACPAGWEQLVPASSLSPCRNRAWHPDPGLSSPGGCSQLTR